MLTVVQLFFNVSNNDIRDACNNRNEFVFLIMKCFNKLVVNTVIDFLWDAFKRSERLLIIE